MTQQPNVSVFGHLPNSDQVHQIKLGHRELSANILTYGAVLQDLRLEGISHPLILGWPTLEGYLNSGAYFGAIVGRFANRIGRAQYEVDGQVCQTDTNFLGKHTLHGGSKGSANQIWQIDAVDKTSVTLSLNMPDGQMGFAGNMEVRATYSIDADQTLHLMIHAECDRPSPCSFAPHSYFNLDGGDTITSHTLRVDAPSYLDVDDDLIPTGQLLPTKESPFDFCTPRLIGRQAIDHNFCVATKRRDLHPVASLSAPKSALRMHLASTEPGLQVYSAAVLDETERCGLNGRSYGAFAGIAMESQSWPDAPNRPGFPSAILYPGSVYTHETTFRFERSE